jgi:hypothetical protein
MGAPKGRKKPPGSGMQKGQSVQRTIEFKESVNNLINWGAERMLGWMEQLDTPEKRLDYVFKFAEYAYPKMARVEHTGKDGGAIETVEIDSKTRRDLLLKLLNETK